MKSGTLTARIKHVLPAVLTTALILPWQPVFATWSIVAVDPDTGEVGSSGASCAGNVERIVGLAPGHGVIVAQALPSGNAKRTGVKMLRSGASPEELVNTISDPDFDTNYMDRQYGVAALHQKGAAATYTGSRNYDWAGHRIGNSMAAQGNYLVSSDVVEDAVAAFEESRNKKHSLADRLLAGLNAGSASGGDRRCGAQRALSAYLIVANPEDEPGSPSTKLIVPEQESGGLNPVELLTEKYLERATK